MGRRPNLEARQRILATALDLIHYRGYNGVSADEVAEAAGIKKANLFYYYPSKEDLALAVFDHAIAKNKARLEAELGRQETPLAVIGAMFDKSAEKMKQKGCTGGCLFGNLAQELSGQNEKMRQRLEEYFRFWNHHLAGVLDRGRAIGYFKSELDPPRAAEAIVAAYEGALLCCKAKKQVCCLESAKEMVLRYLQAYLAAPIPA
jgi:TetR/AcrR family transcriptional repressor of nem operon